MSRFVFPTIVLVAFPVAFVFSDERPKKKTNPESAGQAETSLLEDSLLLEDHADLNIDPVFERYVDLDLLAEV